MAQHKVWPYRILGLDRNASLASAHAAHKRLCAGLGTSPMDVARRGRYDTALAWCVEHWLDAVILPSHGPFKPTSFKPAPEGGRKRPESQAQGRRAEDGPAGGPGASPGRQADESAVVKALPPPSPPPVPPPTPRSAAEVLALRRARAAYRAAIAALSEPTPVRIWRA